MIPVSEVRCIHVANNTAVYTDSTCSPVPEPAVQYQQYQYPSTAGSTPAPEYTAVYPCCSTPITLSFTTCQHNTDTTMGITITDNLVDTTLYRDH